MSFSVTGGGATGTIYAGSVVGTACSTGIVIYCRTKIYVLSAAGPGLINSAVDTTSHQNTHRSS